MREGIERKFGGKKFLEFIFKKTCRDKKDYYLCIPETERDEGKREILHLRVKLYRIKFFELMR